MIRCPRCKSPHDGAELALALRKLSALRKMIDSDHMQRTRWLALRLVDGAMECLGGRPSDEQIEHAYVERHICRVIPLRDLLLPEEGT